MGLMNSFRRSMKFFALAFFAGSLFSSWPAWGQFCGGGGGHDGCDVTVGIHTMRLTAYQPESAPGKSFCGEVPEAGNTSFILDLADPELRLMPIGFRIIRDTGSETDPDSATVLDVAPKTYPAGFAKFQHTFTEPGKFVVVVLIGNDAPQVARIAFLVGESNLSWLLAGSGAILAAGAFAAFSLRRRNTEGDEIKPRTE
jgi:hypothetical protein